MKTLRPRETPTVLSRSRTPRATGPTQEVLTERMSRPRIDSLGTTALALAATIAVNAVLGFGFWALAARLYRPDALGQDAALISVMMLLSVVAQLNLGMGITRLLPQVGGRRWLPVAAAYASTAVAGLAVTVCFLAVVPRLSKGFAFLRGDPALALGLTGAVVVWNIFALQDAALTAVRRAPFVPIENGIFGVLKIGLMIWLAQTISGHGIFVAWIVAAGLMVGPVNGLLFSRILRAGDRSSLPAQTTILPLSDRQRVARYLAGDYAAALCSQGQNVLLPIVVLGVLGADANAHFYIAFLIAGAIAAVAQSLSTSLVVEGSHDESALASLARRSVTRYLGLVLPGVVLLALGSNIVLRPFGSGYATHGETLLKLLLAGTVPRALVSIYVGAERVRARVGRVLAVEATTVVLITIGALIGTKQYGLVGTGASWVVSQFVVCVLIARPLRDVLVGRAGTEQSRP